MSLKNYGDFGAEWAYSKVQPRLLVEPFISEIASLPIDYKLWTFNGRVELIQVDTDRETDHKRTMFDCDWKRLPFTTIYPIDERPIERPATLPEMLDAASILSENVPFVRVDLYEIDKKPRFGELTYYPESGWGPFFPAEYDRRVGDLW